MIPLDSHDITGKGDNPRHTGILVVLVLPGTSDDATSS